MPRPLTVLALTRNTGGFYHGELLAGLTREVGASGGRVVVVQTSDPGTDTWDNVEPPEFSLPLAWDEVDGVVVVAYGVDAPYVQRLKDLGKPVVLADHGITGISAPSVMPDNRGGITVATEHLLAHGHRRIGFVGNLDQVDFRERYAAYQQVLAAHGLPASESLCYFADSYSEAAGEKAGHEMLARGDLPSAVVAATDSNAIGLMRTLQAAGVRVPQDISVIGFDNIEDAIFGTPSLSSVDQHFDEVGALAARLVMSAVDGYPPPSVPHIARSAVLTTRGSCGCKTDLQDTREGGGMPLDVLSGARVREELRGLLGTLFARYDRSGASSEATAVSIRAIEDLVLSSTALTERQVRELVAHLRGLTRDDEALYRIASALGEFVQRLAERDESVVSALWQLQLRGYVERSRRLAGVVLEQHRVATDLITAQATRPEQLGWLERSNVRAAVLGLWDGDPGVGCLRVTGVHDPAGVLDLAAGTRVPVREFPPIGFLDAAASNDGEVCLIVLVRSGENDWGVLALLVTIDTVASHETYLQWAGLLGSAFEERDLQRSVRISEERYAMAALASNDGLWELDLGTRQMYLSARCRELLGVSADAAIDPEGWTASVHPEDRLRVSDAMRTAMDNREPIESEYRVQRPDGQWRWVLSRGLGVTSASGEVVRLVGSLADTHPRKELEEQLRQRALFDAVTSLPNRRLFLDRLSVAVAQPSRRPGARFAVIFLDLDGFKLVNDSLGHLVGDQLLIVVAERLRAQLRTVDTAARFGGDEFAVLLTDPQPDEVLSITRRIQASIAEPVLLAGQHVTVTASAGIATSESGYTDPEDVLRDADIAMYEAKLAERGSASMFDPEMHVRASRRLRARGEVRTALAERQFVVHYQPIVPLDGSALVHFEALVRWQHPTRGLLGPIEFLPAMEDDGTIVALGRWVLDEVCRQLGEWRTALPRHAIVSVNISHHEFWAKGLAEAVREALTRNDVPPTDLVLEITESVIMTDLDRARAVMDELHAMGLLLHIDDFGTGQSSLHALRSFPVDALKIDGSFIRELGTVEETTELVRIIVEIGRVLGMEVVAECVETPDQADRLRALGCDSAQGWLYARALPAAEAGALIGHPLAMMLEPTRGADSSLR